MQHFRPLSGPLIGRGDARRMVEPEMRQGTGLIDAKADNDTFIIPMARWEPTLLQLQLQLFHIRG